MQCQRFLHCTLHPIAKNTGTGISDASEKNQGPVLRLLSSQLPRRCSRLERFYCGEKYFLLSKRTHLEIGAIILGDERRVALTENLKANWCHS
jgi:hypothetical protein